MSINTKLWQCMLKNIPMCNYLLRLISESTDFLVLLENQLSLSGCCLILFLKTFDLRLKRKPIFLMYCNIFKTATLPYCMNSIYMDINVYSELIWPKPVLLPVVPGASFWVPVVVCLFVDNCHLFLCCGFVVFVVPAKTTLLSSFPLMLSHEVSVKMTRKTD